MKKSDFDRLLERYLNGEISDAEKIKLETWLDVIKTRHHGSVELSKDDEDRLFRKITGNIDAKEFGEVLDGSPRPKPERWILRIVATLLILFAATFGVWYFAGRYSGILPWQTQQGTDKLILSDGSLVWLRGDSKLVYYEKPDEGIRYSELQGEALFEVAKDARRPFVVQCGDVKLKVLGTSFSIKRDTNQLEVRVLTGKVNLSSVDSGLTVDIESNEQVIYRSNGEIEKLTMARETIDAIVENTEYDMEFSDVPMAEVFGKIEEKFDVKVSLENSEIGRCRITADLTDHSIESTLQMITEVLAVTYDREGDVITFRGKGCR